MILFNIEEFTKYIENRLSPSSNITSNHARLHSDLEREVRQIY